MKWNKRKIIDLLLFVGIEPTGTMFQTINNKRQLKKLKKLKGRKQIVLCVCINYCVIGNIRAYDYCMTSGAKQRANS